MPDSAPDERATDTPVKVLLKPRKAGPFFGRHPWVFESAVAAVECESGEAPPPGTPVELWSHDHRFIAHGLWNGHSTICVRLYSWARDQPISEDLIADRIRCAVQLRRSLFDLQSETTGCRLVFSEADGLSGLTVDFYGGFVLVQFTSLALYSLRDHIVTAIQKELSPRGIWLRTEKGMREAEHLEATDGLIAGSEPPRPLFIEDRGIRYGVDVQQGQKTGCYLDQRDNRLVAARYLNGRSVLDAFCFSGGFGITAVRSGQAVSVLGIDSSEPALVLARSNAQLNGVAENCRYQHGDVRKQLDVLAEEDASFGAFILDPPRMARTRAGLSRAIKGYTRLNTAALKVLEPGGILITCSCSGLVSRGDFLQMIAETARVSGRFIQILEQCGQPPDHPVAATCPETEYLKMLVCRVM